MEHRKKQGTCILVCAGEWTGAEVECGKEDILVAVDNGLKYILELGKVPDVIIGDFDSLKEELQSEPERFKAAGIPVFHLPEEKDDTDTLYAIREGLRLGYRHFALYGALGGRLDHTIANLQCLRFIKEHGADGVIRDKDQEIFMLMDERRDFPKGTKGGLSLFAAGGTARGVTIRGMKYNAENITLTPDFPIGESNEFCQTESGSVEVKDGCVLAVVRYGGSH